MGMWVMEVAPTSSPAWHPFLGVQQPCTHPPSSGPWCPWGSATALSVRTTPFSMAASSPKLWPGVRQAATGPYWWSSWAVVRWPARKGVGVEGCIKALHKGM